VQFLCPGRAKRLELGRRPALVPPPPQTGGLREWGIKFQNGVDAGAEVSAVEPVDHTRVRNLEDVTGCVLREVVSLTVAEDQIDRDLRRVAEPHTAAGVVGRLGAKAGDCGNCVDMGDNGDDVKLVAQFTIFDRIQMEQIVARARGHVVLLAGLKECGAIEQDFADIFGTIESPISDVDRSTADDVNSIDVKV
jgi:hypothetical protein